MLRSLFGILSRLISRLISRQKSRDTSPTPPQQPQLPPGSSSKTWISIEEFKEATGLSTAKAQEWYGPISAACLEFSVTTPIRISAFLAQVGHESGSFVYTREIWGPTPAQQRYEGRKDLGNTQPGDGSRFRGRGLIQITGRYNYSKVAEALGVDVVSNPALLERPVLAARASAWWWHAHGCNEIADTGDFTALTRRINGGTNGLADRITRYNRARAALGIA